MFYYNNLLNSEEEDAITPRDLTQIIQKQKYTVLIFLEDEVEKYNLEAVNYIVENFGNEEMKILFLWNENIAAEEVDSYPFKRELNYWFNTESIQEYSQVMVVNKDSDIIYEATSLGDATDKLINYYHDKKKAVISHLLSMKAFLLANENSSKDLVAFLYLLVVLVMKL